jgi:dienelactone hydrolase
MTLRDLASHGYIVFAINHQDGSNIHTVLRDGTDKFYGRKEELEIRDKREPQLRRREEEMKELINDLINPESRAEGVIGSAKLPDWMHLDTHQLVVSGHSFGGTTAIRTSLNLPEAVKAVLTFDPWIYPYDEEALNGHMKVTAPLIAVNTEFFHHITTFDVWKAIESVFKASSESGSNQCWKVLNFYHRLQTDLGVLIPIEFSAIERFRPSTRDPYRYFMHT